MFRCPMLSVYRCTHTLRFLQYIIYACGDSATTGRRWAGVLPGCDGDVLPQTCIGEIPPRRAGFCLRRERLPVVGRAIFSLFEIFLFFFEKPLDNWKKKGYNKQADLRRATKKPTIKHGRIRSLKIEQHEEEKRTLKSVKISSENFEKRNSNKSN